MTPVLKLGFCPPIDQPRAFAEAYSKRTHGAATPSAPGSGSPRHCAAGSPRHCAAGSPRNCVAGSCGSAAATARIAPLASSSVSNASRSSSSSRSGLTCFGLSQSTRRSFSHVPGRSLKRQFPVRFDLFRQSRGSRTWNRMMRRCEKK